MDTPSLVDSPAVRHEAKLALRPAWLLAAGLALGLYGLTVAPDVLMLDSGEYQWATWLFPHLELPQGPGNLVRVHVNYLLAAKAFGLLVPAGPWALKINLFSGLMAAIATGNVCALTWALTRSKPATVLAGLALAMGQTFWQYAVIAEVLSLQAAMVSAEILVLYLWTRSWQFRWLAALFVINGLAVGAHIQAGLATPIYLVVAILAWRQGKVRWSQMGLCAVLWLVGFAPYGAFWLRQLAGQDSVGEALASATVGGYGQQIFTLRPIIWLRGLLFVGLNYPTGLAALFVPGLVRLCRSDLPGLFCWAWLAVLVVNLLFAMTYAVPDQQSFFVPTYAAAGPLIGLGAAWILRSRAAWTIEFVLAGLVVPVYALLPSIVRHPGVAGRLPIPAASSIPYRDPYEFYLKPWKTGRHNERRYIEEAFEVLPPEAIFLCSRTVRDGVRAWQLTENRRQDVTLQFPQEFVEGLADRPDLLSAWDRPVYAWAASRSQGVPEVLLRHCRFVPRGLVWEVQPPREPDRLAEELRDPPAVHAPASEFRRDSTVANSAATAPSARKQGQAERQEMNR